MKIPALFPGEDVRIRSPDVYVKSGRFTAFLTTHRIILIDPSDDLMPGKELPVDTVSGMEPGENQNGEPVLCILSRVSHGEIRRLILIFSRNGGVVRTGERDTWVREISRYCRGPLRTSAGIPVPARKMDPRDQVPFRNTKPLFHDGIHESVNTGEGKQEKLPEVIVFPDVRKDLRKPYLKEPAAGSWEAGKTGMTVPGHTGPETRPAPAIPGSPGGIGTPCLPSQRSFFYCMACGNRVPSGASFCNRCGATVIPPDEGVVCSPWDSLRDPEATGDLAMRWGVPVAPAPGARPPVSSGGTNASQPLAYEQPGIDPLQPLMPERMPREPGLRVRGSGFPVRQAALVAAIIVFAGVLLAAIGGFLTGGFFGDTPPVNAGSGSLVSGENMNDSGSSGLSDTVSDADTSSGTSTSSGSTGSPVAASSSGTASDTAASSIPSTGTYVKVSSSGTWEGTYGAVPAVWAVKGTGDMVYKVDDTGDSGSVSAVFTKDDTTSNDLVVQLYKDGQVIKSGNTATPSGSVTLVEGT